MSAFETQISVRFRDLDATGYVNNSVFPVYFGEGRRRFFSAFFGVSDPAAFPFIMARMSCEYLKPIQLFSELGLEIWVKEMGNKSFSLGYRLFDASDKTVVCATGESVQVCYDYMLGKPVELPEELRKALEEYLITEFPDLC